MINHPRGAPCSIENCTNLVDAKGYCKMHYARWRRRGDANCSVRAWRRPAGEAARNSLFSSYKIEAIKRKIEWNLSLEQCELAWKGNCFYCNCAPSQKHGRKVRANGQYIFNGIDRVDNTKGYVANNVVSCCKTCNSAKMNKSKKEFIDWIKRITLNLPRIEQELR